MLDNYIALFKENNCAYSYCSEFLVRSWSGINQIFDQESYKELCDCGYKVPSVAAVLDQLSNQPYKVLKDGFDLMF